MIVHREFAQNSLQWLTARAGIPTASEFNQLLTPKFEIRTGEMPKTYLARKLAEYWLGGPLPGFGTLDMEFGQILEQEAKPWFALEYDLQIESVGFVTTDDGRVGCSPDGLITDSNGIEIKCPEPQTHCKYLLAGTLPPDYAAQVHGAMYVTGGSHWYFVSYRRRFPALVLLVERDEKIQEAIDSALGEFLARFETAKERLIELNGGPPKRAKVADRDPAWVSEEVIP